MKEYLEFHDAKSHKFWQIEVVGNTQKVIFGKVGTDGQSKTKEFSSDEEALKDANKTINSKIKKGYVKTETKSEKIVTHKFAVADYDDSVEVVLEKLDKFFKKPDVEQTNSIIIGNWGEAWEGGPEEVIKKILENKDKLPNLKSFFIGDMDYEECEISWIYQDDLSPILKAFKGLENLKIKGSMGLSLGKIDHDNLKSLIIECGGLGKDVINQIANAKIPKLEHLELYLGTDDYGFDGSIEDIKPFMKKGLFPKLTYLGLKDSIMQDEIATEIANAEILDQIEVLDLSLGTLGDKGAQSLVESPKIKNLKKLDLHYHYMSKEMMKKIKDIGITVDVSDQQDEEDEEDRYVSVSE